MPRHPGRPPARRIRAAGDFTARDMETARRNATAIVDMDWDGVEICLCPVVLEEVFVCWLAENDTQDLKPGKIKQNFHVFRRKAWKSWRNWYEALDGPGPYVLNAELSDILNPRSPRFEELHYGTVSELRRRGYDALSM